MSMGMSVGTDDDCAFEMAFLLGLHFSGRHHRLRCSLEKQAGASPALASLLQHAHHLE